VTKLKSFLGLCSYYWLFVRDFAIIDELEALAIIYGFKQFHAYLTQRKTIVISMTDHSSLQFILKKPNPSPRISRWGLCLQQYDYEVKHRPGKTNTNADALSGVFQSLALTQSIPDKENKIVNLLNPNS